MDTVGAFMSSPVLSTNPDALAYDAARDMFDHNVGALLVKDNGKATPWLLKFHQS